MIHREPQEKIAVAGNIQLLHQDEQAPAGVYTGNRFGVGSICIDRVEIVPSF
jgi:hypothetical protein